ncbi:DUF3592 domain-containing protein [Cellulomonas sp. NPDC057328]|uniref:DUF3592 domain-containing protein n=1 Tax=Cellulomonas sp. NPDC057328 TaxID=3346101 RepID=UPI0036410D09
MAMTWGVFVLGALAGLTLVVAGAAIVRTGRAREQRAAPVPATVLAVDGRYLDLGYHVDGRPFRHRGRSARFVRGPLPAAGTRITVYVDPQRPAVAQAPGELRLAASLGWVHLACGVVLLVAVAVITLHLVGGDR